MKLFFSIDLTSVIIPNSVINIGYRAFYSNNLTSIIVPDSVINIGDEAFGWNNLIPSNIAIKCPLPTFGSNVFTNNGASKTTNIVNPTTCTP